MYDEQDLERDRRDLRSPRLSMIVVSDTSPINYLIFIELQHLPPKLFDRQGNPGARPAVSIDDAENCAFASTPERERLQRDDGERRRAPQFPRAERASWTSSPSMDTSPLLDGGQVPHVASRDGRPERPVGDRMQRQRASSWLKGHQQSTTMDDGVYEVLIARALSRADGRRVRALSDVPEPSWLRRVVSGCSSHLFGGRGLAYDTCVAHIMRLGRRGQPIAVQNAQPRFTPGDVRWMLTACAGAPGGPNVFASERYRGSVDCCSVRSDRGAVEARRRATD